MLTRLIVALVVLKVALVAARALTLHAFAAGLAQAPDHNCCKDLPA